MAFTDLHSHILPGIDDGPRSIEDSVAMARAYLESGTVLVAATPHVNQRWGIRANEVIRLFDEVTAELSLRSVDLELVRGGEVQLSTAIDLDEDTLESFRLAGGDWLLLEPPSAGPSAGLHSMIFEIQSRGHRVLLAHPERCETFQNDVELLASLVAGGVRTQVTASALTGRFGSAANQAARLFFDRDLVHTVAGDAHDAINRPPGLDTHLRQAGLGWMSDWLCRDMPSMILDGGPEPVRPERPDHPSLWSRLFGKRTP